MYRLSESKKSILLIIVGLSFSTSYYLRDFLVLLFSLILLLIYSNIFIFKLSKIKSYITIIISILFSFSIFEVIYKTYPLLKKEDQNRLVYDSKILKEYPIQEGLIKFRQFEDGLNVQINSVICNLAG